MAVQDTTRRAAWGADAIRTRDKGVGAVLEAFGLIGRKVVLEGREGHSHVPTTRIGGCQCVLGRSPSTARDQGRVGARSPVDSDDPEAAGLCFEGRPGDADQLTAAIGMRSGRAAADDGRPEGPQECP